MAISKEESQKSAQIIQKSWWFQNFFPLEIGWFFSQKVSEKGPLTMLLGIFFNSKIVKFCHKNKKQKSLVLNIVE
jgi:hypothetical protein